MCKSSPARKPDALLPLSHDLHPRKHVEFEIVPGGIPQETERQDHSETCQCNEQGWERKEPFLTRGGPNFLGMLVQLSSISGGTVLSNVAAIGPNPTLTLLVR